ncbi:MAG TPA: metalloregulator ArsR/SmtB family transcription factor [Candidatus Binataceae bacterium]
MRASRSFAGPLGSCILTLKELICNSVFGEIPLGGLTMGVNEVFRALGDPTRREILRLLKEKDLSAGELAERFPLSKSTLSGHFSVLRHAGLVVSERYANRIVYSLNVSAFEQALGAAFELLSVRAAGRRRSKRARNKRVLINAIHLAH